jgi:hypothetical protein
MPGDGEQADGEDEEEAQGLQLRDRRMPRIAILRVKRPANRNTHHRLGQI